MYSSYGYASVVPAACRLRFLAASGFFLSFFEMMNVGFVVLSFTLFPFPAKCPVGGTVISQ